ncbi:MAG: LD-carboxypeptidase, partial [Bacteroidales bacterium]|nr:LD-carboxypeptidase [Bacteroidales bacterium]
HENPDDDCVQNIIKVITGQKMSYSFDKHELNRMGECCGELVGGNLSIIYSLQGTDLAIDCDDKILFIEDLNEYLYHLDRMMINLKMSGKLSRLKGLVVGGFSDMLDNAKPFGLTAYEIVKQHTSEYSYPVAFGFPVGHGERNQPLVEGGRYKLRVTEDDCSLVQM